MSDWKKMLDKVCFPVYNKIIKNGIIESTLIQDKSYKTLENRRIKINDAERYCLNYNFYRPQGLNDGCDMFHGHFK
jgi:hypothetical protein